MLKRHARNHFFEIRKISPAFQLLKRALIVWLMLCASALLLLPHWIPSDGLLWKPDKTGLKVERSIERRSHDLAPGQHIVFVGGVPWRATQNLHDFRSLHVQGNGAAGYEFVDEAKWLARRNVALTPLATDSVMKSYAPHSLVLVLLALAVWLIPMPTLMIAGLAACGTEFTILSIAQMGPATFFSLGLRHLELAAALVVWGLAALFAIPLHARRLPWLFLGLAVILWLLNSDRWVWWHQMKVMAVAEALILATALLISLVRKKMN